METYVERRQACLLNERDTPESYNIFCLIQRQLSLAEVVLQLYVVYPPTLRGFLPCSLTKFRAKSLIVYVMEPVFIAVCYDV